MPVRPHSLICKTRIQLARSKFELPSASARLPLPPAPPLSCPPDLTPPLPPSLHSPRRRTKATPTPYKVYLRVSSSCCLSSSSSSFHRTTMAAANLLASLGGTGCHERREIRASLFGPGDRLCVRKQTGRHECFRLHYSRPVGFLTQSRSPKLKKEALISPESP